MLPELTQAEIVNGVVPATVLASDLGPARTIGPMRPACGRRARPAPRLSPGPAVAGQTRPAILR